MTTATASLASFLIQRLDEDEAVARAAISSEVGDDGRWWRGVQTEKGGEVFAGARAIEVTQWATFESPDHIARHDPARVLADVAAKRKIVEQAVGMLEVSRVMGSEDPGAETVLRALASVYADHPAFDEVWR